MEAVSENKEARVVEDVAGGALKVYEDGSILRTDQPLIINVPPSQNPRLDHSGVASRDVVIDEELGIWVRLYLPLLLHTPKSTFPILLYFHGGGFCFFSPAFLTHHQFCQKWALNLRAIFVSVNCRQAPERRLPAAYDDSITVFQWLTSHSQSDSWLSAYADFNNVFLIGDSSGGNIAHHLLMRIACDIPRSLQIVRGVILLQPFFGGEERTQSEIVCPPDTHVSVEACDTFWRLALPVGSNRNHPFSNPVLSLQLPSVAIPPMLVVLGGKDCLRDKGLEYYQAIHKSGKCKRIDLIEFEEEEHGFHHSFRAKTEEEVEAEDNNTLILIRKAALFLSSNCQHI